MKKSEKMLLQIRKHYTYENLCYINHADLIRHLQNNEIDHLTQSKYIYNGYDISFDNSLCIFYYSDKSVLIVNCDGSLSAY
jgi:hypothetical protein